MGHLQSDKYTEGLHMYTLHVHLRSSTSMFLHSPRELLFDSPILLSWLTMATVYSRFRRWFILVHLWRHIKAPKLPPNPMIKGGLELFCSNMIDGGRVNDWYFWMNHLSEIQLFTFHENISQWVIVAEYKFLLYF